MTWKIWTALLLGLAITACGEQPSRETIGTGTGAVIGGAIGSQVGDGTTGTVIGGIVGAIAGREIGQRMDAQDREQAYQALEQNRTVTWQGDQGERYTVNPTQTFERDNRVCRRYETTVMVEGQAERATGTACKRADGSWEIIG